MIKPIIYHNIEEKEALERKLMSAIPYEERVSNSKALMDIFAPQTKQLPVSKRKKKTHGK
jgi:hypothetical protein